MSRAAALLLLLTVTEARADGPWAIALGAGPAVQQVGPNGELTFGATSRLDTGYRLIDRGAVAAGIGVHLGIAFVRARDYGGDEQTYVPFELGLSAQVLIADRVLILPWAGTLDDGHRLTHRAAGIELGYDILVRGHDRISAVAMFTRSPGTGGDSYNGIGAGIAYRYW